ncbi:hypothetical protein [Ruminiclostridium papyrosolvens]|uniref:Uncharacterized protein n=1 Tax=Ruminiclostridium papyrosolvens C7 TaxID=1330534 RepID=U4R294_9FIRM|nr:hypothetical protein [Ruminiclostridium papyrosolvens]EPR12212.1 hypothetical protein L323_08990 [Ruminiclostridium papyrosolvens C7]
MRDHLEFSGPMVEWPHVDVIPGVKDVMSKIYKSYICCVDQMQEILIWN